MCMNSPWYQIVVPHVKKIPWAIMEEYMMTLGSMNRPVSYILIFHILIKLNVGVRYIVMHTISDIHRIEHMS